MLAPTVALMLDDATPPARQVGVAVVGLGEWGPNLLRVLGESFETQVRWLCDVDSSRLAKYRCHYPGARVTTRLDRILADPGVDAVVLATPTETHYDLAMQVLDAGKHVFVETPLAMSADLAEDLAILGRARRRIVMCGHTHLYSPQVRAVKRKIEAGTLGDVYSISSSRMSLAPNGGAASVIWDLGPHDFSVLLYFLSEVPTSVRAVGRDAVLEGVADVAFVTMNFESGIVVNVELSWLAPSELSRTVVVGSKRMVVNDPSNEPSIDSYEPLKAQLGDFTQAILAGDLMEYQTALARNVVRIAEAADESLRLGGAEVSLSADEADCQLTPRRVLVAV